MRPDRASSPTYRKHPAIVAVGRFLLSSSLIQPLQNQVFFCDFRHIDQLICADNWSRRSGAAERECGAATTCAEAAHKCARASLNQQQLAALNRSRCCDCCCGAHVAARQQIWPLATRARCRGDPFAFVDVRLTLSRTRAAPWFPTSILVHRIGLILRYVSAIFLDSLFRFCHPPD